MVGNEGPKKDNITHMRSQTWLDDYRRGVGTRKHSGAVGVEREAVGEMVEI